MFADRSYVVRGFRPNKMDSDGFLYCVPSNLPLNSLNAMQIIDRTLKKYDISRYRRGRYALRRVFLQPC